MQKDFEIIVLAMVGIGLSTVVLLAIADTPAYPLAIGIELVVILYFLIGKPNSTAPISAANMVGTITKFISNPTQFAKGSS
jgi:hypothetical protein